MPLTPQAQGAIDSYVSTIVNAGGIPLLIPLIENTDDILQLFECCDGLLLCGGEDIHPSHYGTNLEKHELGDETVTEMMQPNSVRDTLEIALVKEAWKNKKPILGVCRGSQLLNIAFGGTLYQDIEQDLGIKGHLALRHKDDSPELLDANIHTVEIECDSRLHSILNTDQIYVNSLHHQAIKDVPQDFMVVAKAPDGIIEAIECKDKNQFAIGVEWHPELLWQRNNAEWINLFKAFVKSASS